MHNPDRTVSFGMTVPGAPWVGRNPFAEPVSVHLWDNVLDEFVDVSHLPVRWTVTVGASVPSRRVPNPSYVVGGLGWVSPAAGLRMEVRR